MGGQREGRSDTFALPAPRPPLSWGPVCAGNFYFGLAGELYPLYGKHGVLTTGLPGKSQKLINAEFLHEMETIQINLIMSEELKRAEGVCGGMFVWMQRKPCRNLIWALPGTCGRGAQSTVEQDSCSLPIGSASFDFSFLTVSHPHDCFSGLFHLCLPGNNLS